VKVIFDALYMSQDGVQQTLGDLSSLLSQEKDEQKAVLLEMKIELLNDLLILRNNDKLNKDDFVNSLLSYLNGPFEEGAKLRSTLNPLIVAVLENLKLVETSINSLGIDQVELTLKNMESYIKTSSEKLNAEIKRLEVEISQSQAVVDRIFANKEFCISKCQELRERKKALPSLMTQKMEAIKYHWWLYEAKCAESDGIGLLEEVLNNEGVR
jgi:hypothetical protein